MKTRSENWALRGGAMGQGNIFGTGSYGLGWALPRLDEALSALLDPARRACRGILLRLRGRTKPAPGMPDGRILGCRFAPWRARFLEESPAFSE